MWGARVDCVKRVRHAMLWGTLRAFGPGIMMGGLWLLVSGFSNYIVTLADVNGPTLALGKPLAGFSLLVVGGVVTVVSRVGRWGRHASESDLPFEAMQINAAELHCPRCLHINEPGVRCCSGCGSPLAACRACPNCRHRNDSDGRICDNCGQALGA